MSENNTAREPLLRFPGFTVPWGQRKLSAISDIIGGGTPSTDIPEYWDGDIDWFAPAEINDQIFVEHSVRKISRLGLEKSSAKILPANKTVLFTSRAGIGKTAILHHDAATNQGFQSMVLKDDTDPYFVFAMTDMIKKKAEIVASGSTFAEISGKMLGKLEFMFPTYAEQIKIGAYFKRIDSIIAFHKRKYEELKIFKNGLLQQMFPQHGEQFPRLRFPGFTAPWEQRKFSKVFSILQNNTLSRADMNYDHGNIKNVHYGDVLIKFGEYIDASTAKLPYINEGLIGTKLEKSLLIDGDIIIADTAEDETVGKCCEICNSEGMRLISGLHTIAARPQQKYASKFLGYYLNSNAYRCQLLPLMQGIKVTSISKGSLQDTILTVPTSLEEQCKIAECLSDIDDLITLYQYKHFELKLYKNGLLQKMFC